MQEIPSLEHQDNQSPSAPPSRSTGVLFLSSFALIAAMISLVFQIFFWDIHKKTREQMIKENRGIHAFLKNEIAVIKQQVTSQQEILKSLMSQNQTEDKKKILMLADEAVHYLILAQINLQYENNFDLAAKQIREADQRLQQITDPNVSQLRTLLMNDLTAVNNTPKVDEAVLLARLSAISEQIAKFSMQPVIPPAKPAKPLAKMNLTWKEKLMSVLNNLRGIVSIRRLPEDIKPLPSSEQQLYLIEQIRLKLTEAEWAVLHRNPELYKASLEQAKKQLEKYYAGHVAGANLLKMIAELEETDIKPHAPDLNNAINSVREYIANLQKSATFSDPVQQPSATATNKVETQANGIVPRVLPS